MEETTPKSENKLDFKSKLKIVLFSFKSEDSKTRKAFFLLLISIFGMIFVSIPRKELTEKERLLTKIEEKSKKTIDTDEKKTIHQEFGVFFIEVKGPNQFERNYDEINMAEVHLSVECESEVACEFLKKNQDFAKDQVSHLLVAIERNVILSTDGKKYIRQVIRDTLNAWLPEGKLKDVYITYFVMS